MNQIFQKLTELSEKLSSLLFYFNHSILSKAN